MRPTLASVTKPARENVSTMAVTLEAMAKRSNARRNVRRSVSNNATLKGKIKLSMRARSFGFAVSADS